MNSPITRIGGKRNLRKQILALFPEPKSFDRYIEPFGGAGWVLFAKDRHAELEVYNDYEEQLVNLFRCVKYHADELQREICGFLTSREFFEDAKLQMNMRGLTDIQRAARYFLAIKLSYGADQRTFGCVSRNLETAAEYLTVVRDRLKAVVIEHKDFEDLINVYDRPSALFYCDPPYHGSEKYYPTAFEKKDHERLAACLRKVKGRFILSYNDDSYIRELYADYHILPVERPHNLVLRDANRNHTYKELLIRNF